MTRPLPADGTAKLFQIGTRPLDPEDWLAPDDQLREQLAEKALLVQTHNDQIFAELPQSRPAQAEVLALLADYLPRRFPQLWVRRGDGIALLPEGETVDLAGSGPPLARAARLVQDDLLLLERDASRWRLTAASLSFPSSWVLREKLGLELDAIHEPVPGFGKGTRPAQIMARMFDAMRAETPMIRWNWSLYGDRRLYHPDSAGPDTRRFGPGERADPVYLRVERQTLRKLEGSGAIVFTIRISLVGLDALARHEEAGQIAAHLQHQIAALTPEQLAYKGLAAERERILMRLEELAANSNA